MPRSTTENIRNIALAGHAGSGKTTLIEKILEHTGVIGKAGTVQNGDTVCDFEPEEKEHQHSLNSAIVNFDHEGKHFNLIDTPGMPDFIGQALGAFPAAGAVAVVIGADKGVQTVTRRVLRTAKERKFPCFIIVNKIDDHVEELEGILENIRETFGNECIPINLPTPDGTDVIDVWEKSEGDVAFSSVAEAHTKLVDQCVEADEKLMETYLEQGELSPEQLHDAFEKSLGQAHLVPVCFCSAQNGTGIADMLHIMAELCPNPLEANPRPFILTKEDGTQEAWHATPNPDKPVVAHVFKVTTDQFVGKLSLMKVHQGTIKANDQLIIDDGKKPVRIGHLLKIHGKDHEEVDQAIPGDIVGIAKVDETHINAVLHTHDTDGLTYKPMDMPKPMYGLALKARSRGDEGKISNALHKIQEEDPTFIVERVAATGQTVARAMGMLHMRVILERLKSRYKLELETEPPKVAYKETIKGQAEGHHRHKKQSGGAGQFGEVYLRVEPYELDASSNGQAYEFIDETVGGSIPKQFLPAIEKGVKNAMVEGVIAGYPLTGVRVSVYDGKHHPVDSKEVAFVTAGKRAFRDAVNKAKPVLLEPVVDVEITAPQSSMGDINSDISSKRGQVLNTDMLPGEACHIHAKVPLAEMTNFTSELKSITAGQGAFTMDYSHDAPAPPNVQSAIVAEFEHKDEED